MWCKLLLLHQIKRIGLLLFIYLVPTPSFHRRSKWKTCDTGESVVLYFTVLQVNAMSSANPTPAPPSNWLNFKLLNVPCLTHANTHTLSVSIFSWKLNVNKILFLVISVYADGRWSYSFMQNVHGPSKHGILARGQYSNVLITELIMSSKTVVPLILVELVLA